MQDALFVGQFERLRINGCLGFHFKLKWMLLRGYEMKASLSFEKMDSMWLEWFYFMIQ